MTQALHPGAADGEWGHLRERLIAQDGAGIHGGEQLGLGFAILRAQEVGAGGDRAIVAVVVAREDVTPARPR